MPPRRRAGPPPQHRLRGCNPSRECTSYEGAAAVAGLGDKLRVDETRSPAPAVHIDEPRPPPTALHLRERRVYTAHQLRGCRRATGRRRHGTGVPRHNQPGYVYKAFSSSVVVAQTIPHHCILPATPPTSCNPSPKVASYGPSCDRVVHRRRECRSDTADAGSSPIQTENTTRHEARGCPQLNDGNDGQICIYMQQSTNLLRNQKVQYYR
mmetsp:Transcript_9572/g.21383  ORF Transcript_9572/g.21383 Transcript_9572/m.21383 type:complete len:210 (-) Transcript_9572:154-783(-)